MTEFVSIGTLTAGDNAVIQILIVDQDNVPIDLTGVQSAKFQISRNGIPVVFKDLNNGVQITSTSEGEIEVSILGSDTVGLTGGCEYEVEILDTDGNFLTPVYGAVGFRRSLIANESQ